MQYKNSFPSYTSLKPHPPRVRCCWLSGAPSPGTDMGAPWGRGVWTASGPCASGCLQASDPGGRNRGMQQALLLTADNCLPQNQTRALLPTWTGYCPAPGRGSQGKPFRSLLCSLVCDFRPGGSEARSRSCVLRGVWPRAPLVVSIGAQASSGEVSTGLAEAVELSGKRDQGREDRR